MKTIIDHLTTLKESLETNLPQFEGGGYVAIESQEMFRYIAFDSKKKVNFDDKLGHYFYLRAWDNIEYLYSESQISACRQSYKWQTLVKLIFFAPKYNPYSIEALVSNQLLCNSNFEDFRIELKSCELDKYKIYEEETNDNTNKNLDKITLVSFTLNILGDKNPVCDPQCIDLTFCDNC